MLFRSIGDRISGWRTYANWTAGDTENSPYLLDETGRMTNTRIRQGAPISVTEAISAMRTILATPGGVVRLIGLSGLGKRRTK